MTKVANRDRAPSSVWRDPRHFLAFGFGVGNLAGAPGTYGTLVAIPMYLLVAHFSWPLYALLVLVMSLFGCYICHVATRDLKVHDHPGIVWDEIVGFFITIFLLPPTFWWIIAGFVVFRFFDILKPWPIRWLDQNINNGIGVMADDVLAGIYGCILLNVLRLIIG
jgi:phosphatidylglycerophosphatase A